MHLRTRLITCAFAIASLSGCGPLTDVSESTPTSSPSARAETLEAPAPARFMTYNICHTEPWCSDAEGSPALKTRTSRVYARIKASKPDVLAVQEGLSLFGGVASVTYDQGGRATSTVDQGSLEEPLGQASKYFKRATTGINYTVAFETEPIHGIGLYINSARYAIVEKDGRPEIKTLSLGLDPQVPERAGPERTTERFAIYAHLLDKKSGRDVWVANTHLSDGNSPAEVEERLAQVAAAARYAEGLSGPVVFLGDFNQARTSTSDPIMNKGFGKSSHFADAQDKATKVQNTRVDSYQGWSHLPRTSPGKVGNHIDRILVRGDVLVSQWAVQTYLRNGQWRTLASDHAPVVLKATVR